MSALAELISSGESEWLEFKTVADPKRVAASVVAMLNGHGGQVLVGVAEDGAIHGVERAQEAADRLRTFLRERVTPAAACDVTSETVGGVEALRIDVPPGSARPYLIDGRILVRRGFATVPATADDLHRMFADRAETDRRWELQPAIGIEVADLDGAEMAAFAEAAESRGRMRLADRTPRAILEALGLTDGERVRRAAVVLFGRDPWPSFPQCVLRLGRFRGIDKEDPADQRVLRGGAFRLLTAAFGFVTENTPVAAAIRGDRLARDDRPLYPPVAVREALANAFCHRDYAPPGGGVSVALFADRLEIASTGGLPEGIQVEDLKGPHLCLPRNPLIADSFYRRGLIELWGGGTQRMIAACAAAGQPPPVFGEPAGHVLVRFPSPDYRPPAVPGHDLSDRHRAIMAALWRGPRPFPDLKKLAAPDVSDSTLRNRLGELRKLDLVRVVGRGPGATWELVDRAGPGAE